MINVEVTTSGTESSTSLLRRFSKRVQGSGIVRKVRSKRYSSRTETKFARKKRLLTRLTKRAAHEELARWGRIKLDEKTQRRRG